MKIDLRKGVLVQSHHVLFTHPGQYLLNLDGFLSDRMAWKNHRLVLRKAAFMREMLKYKGEVCFRCKHIFSHRMYDFHHRDPSEKESRVALMMFASREAAKAEADKCDLLCVVCHRQVHLEMALAETGRKRDKWIQEIAKSEENTTEEGASSPGMSLTPSDSTSTKVTLSSISFGGEKKEASKISEKPNITSTG